MFRSYNITGWADKHVLRMNRTVLCAEHCRVRESEPFKSDSKASFTVICSDVGSIHDSDRLASPHGRAAKDTPKNGGVIMTAQMLTTTARSLRACLPSLNQLFDKVLAIPGVSEVLKPTIDALRAKLAVLTA